MALRINTATWLRAIAALSLMIWASGAHAQTQCSKISQSTSTSNTAYQEDFTCGISANQWFFYNGACLTAGTSTSTTSPGYLPACTTVLTTYYNPVIGKKQSDAYLAGGYAGFLGGSSAPTTPSAQQADPIINDIGHGALRFTNANGTGSYGYNENGAIVSNFWFPTNQGIQITFKTATYYGNAGGSASDGADGISFYLLDACMPIAVSGGGTSTLPSVCNSTTTPFSTIYGTGLTFPGIGAWGGSLAYSCSNSNFPYDGLVGAYLGLGIDEYGNFLNGTSNTLGETGSSGGGDNTATGGLYQPGRIGLRGAGSVSWAALNNVYGTNQGSNTPYYPSTMASSCQTGTWDSVSGTCQSCSSGTLDDYGGNGPACYSCSAGSYSAGTGNCINVCSGTGYSGYTYSSSAGACVKSGSPNKTPKTAAASTSSSSLGVTWAQYSVKYTCSTGNLYNWSTLTNSPSNLSPAVTLGLNGNSANLMDYPAISGGYSVLSGVKIANEGSAYREGNPVGCTAAAGNCNYTGSGSSKVYQTPATPITYKLKITPDGYLTFQYSYNGGSYQTVINNQSITSSNGAIPANVRFGFAGSTGGSTNIHEIACFKATPSETSNTSGTVTVYENPVLRTGAQVYTAFYNPSAWTGQLEAQAIVFDTTHNVLAVTSTPNWDASCVLTGVDSTTGACSTGATAMTAESPTATGGGRQIFTWNGSTGVNFEWGSLSSAQQTALGVSTRLDYLRGVRTNEYTSTNTSGIYRYRKSVLSDIVDSSPVWVGPPQTYNTSLTTWTDNLNTTTAQQENSGDTYATFATNEASRLNVVYVGANDGMVHGFRAGTLDSSGNLVNSTPSLNDGWEVLGFMPNAVVNTIHNSSNSLLDYSNTLYSHNWFVDATPGTGDLFYNGHWHTWLVGGLGAGGAAIYALDITDSSSFSESSTTGASSTVIGEWDASGLTCSQPSGACGQYLGNTYGTPEIRRFHNGLWGVIFGNGFGSSNGTAGIFILLVNKDGTTSLVYLPSGSSTTGNGIASVGSLDIDGDHVVDYLYAGDLQGNVWRWDVTGNSVATWAAATPFLLYKTPGGASQPITTRVTAGTLRTVTSTVTVSGQTLASGPERVIVNFGTGQMTPQTVTTPTTYATGTQYLFGIWDWNLSGWTYAGQPTVNLSTSSGPGTLSGLSNLQVQTVTTTAAATTSQVATRSVSKTAFCWVGDAGCTGGVYGWYIALPGTNEQIIYDPVISPDGELVVNSLIPVSDSPLICSTATSTGFSMALQPDSGTGSPTPYFTVATNNNVQVDGVQLNGTGTPTFLSSGQAGDHNAEYMITQTGSGVANPTQVNRHSIVNGQRLNWTQKR